MNFVPVKTPWLLKRIFPNYVWDIKTTEKVIYLTFDDGPTPEITPWVLEVLKQYNAKATFFCIGNNIQKHAAIFNHVIGDGHAIGNHTFNHPHGWKMDTENYLDEVLKTNDTIDNHLSTRVTLFRPPYGQITSKQGKKLIGLGYKIIMWDVLAFDWKNNISNKKCYQNIISKTTSGSIVVFHDSLKAAERLQFALPKVLKYFSEKGFEFKRIPE
ncbi:MAG TPA: polysaccharide deacetylase family protein [Aquaticitalea sp.]|nr:polysaccharide deacetylase family protein [Aquaticitalea sp.]